MRRQSLLSQPSRNLIRFQTNGSGGDFRMTHPLLQLCAIAHHTVNYGYNCHDAGPWRSQAD